MCSNYQPIKRSNNPWVKNHFGIDLPDADWKGHTWPMDKAPFIFMDKGVLRCELGKFGLEPFWAASKPNFGRRTYNARSETVHQLASYRSAWKERRFGLVLAEQFFEPIYREAKPDWAAISRKDNEPTAIGSIWESYIDAKTGEVIRSFSMLTLNADDHPFMQQFHEPGKEKRSVVIVEPGDFNKWLNANHDQARGLIKLPNGNALEYEV
ncbi:MAG TPA: SOS response-associated peptidase family protein [Methylophilus sp.]|uniref:SOS response-associated peptidase family protein n=1 Tax=Methylophilus sp. TaxID=29541 RepID=UPI002C0F342F|nr:SOS response-associated peptidase family protein [Methylophilus sp.]HSH86905.1 SOS response-associated peptidase family protein [Methylophilus sp.]